MSAFEILAPLEPFLSGQYRWWGMGIAAAPVVLCVLTVFVVRKQRTDGVRLCEKCSYRVDPTVSSAQALPARCPECGTVVGRMQRGITIESRRKIIGMGILGTCILAAPLLAWNNCHIALGRLLLPRWVENQRAELPNGLVVAEEADPVLTWLHFPPNYDKRAWDGLLWERDPSGKAKRYGDRTNSHRVGMWLRSGEGSPRPTDAVDYFAGDGIEYGFLGAGEGRMPAGPSAGFCDRGVSDADVYLRDIGGPAHAWMRIGLSISPGESGQPDLSWHCSERYTGTFRLDPNRGDWVFYELQEDFGPSSLTEIGCKVTVPGEPRAWRKDVDDWICDASRLRVRPDEALLHALGEEVQREWKQAQKSKSAAALADELDAWSGEAFIDWTKAPCPRVLAPICNGLVELSITGHRRQRAEWMAKVWPAELSRESRDRVLREITVQIGRAPVMNLVEERRVTARP